MRSVTEACYLVDSFANSADGTSTQRASSSHLRPSTSVGSKVTRRSRVTCVKAYDENATNNAENVNLYNAQKCLTFGSRGAVLLSNHDRRRNAATRGRVGNACFSAGAVSRAIPFSPVGAKAVLLGARRICSVPVSARSGGPSLGSWLGSGDISLLDLFLLESKKWEVA